MQVDISSISMEAPVLGHGIEATGVLREGGDTPVTSPTARCKFKDEAANATWQKALDATIPAIVVIRVCAVRPFEGSGANYSYATGFVVNKDKGIILTNRHVITAGPVIADAILLNKEEIDLQPLYRDPVHDFGFARFNPADVKYMTVTEIPLDPDGARVGREIRVVGNDAGEKLSILPGILARVDRSAPVYGNDYNDFNTFYLCAASSTSGGSSGSPVLTIEGKAIALNCGAAKKAASSFYLPLHRIKRALQLLEGGGPIPRGTLQTVWKHKAFDEVRRLGLTAEKEGDVRRRLVNETGMLVVDQVVPKGPADGLLEPGDILLEIEGQLATTFLLTEQVLDDNVGSDVTLLVQRGGVDRVVKCKIGDLHAIVPSEFLTFSAGVVHPLSYHHAKNYHLPVGGVYMASSGYAFTRAGIGVHCIFIAIGPTPTPDLDAFQAALESHPDGTRISIQYFALSDRNRTRTGIITIDRTWFPMGRFKRTDPTWTFTPAKEPPALPITNGITGHKRRRMSPDPREVGIRESLVIVSYDVPYLCDGISSGEYVGVGVVFDKEQGLVLVDRSTVPLALGDCLVTVGGTVEVRGSVVLVHPIHNFAVIRYDPADLGDAAYQVAEADFSDARLSVGDAVTFHGLTAPFVSVYCRSVVTKTDLLKLSDGRPPQFVGANAWVYYFDQVASCTGGVFEGPDGRIAALWLCFAYQADGETKQVYRGVPSEVVVDILRQLKGGGSVPATVPSLPVKFTSIQLAKAKAGMGLSEASYHSLLRKVRTTPGAEASLLMVRRVAAGTPLAGVCKTGDVLLSVDGEPVLRPSEVDKHVKADSGGTVKLTVLRNHEEMTLDVDPMEIDLFGTARLVLWSGLMLQQPHLAVKWLGYVPEEGSGVYVSRWSYGSPAQKYGLRATCWVVEVNGVATPDLDTFLATVSKVKDSAPIRLKTRDLDGKNKVFSIRPCYEYWPTTEITWRQQEQKWHMARLPAPDAMEE